MNGQPQSIGELFLQQVTTRPDAMALLVPRDHPQCFSWRQLAELVADALEHFDRRGIEAHAHVATWLPNGLAWIVVDLACQLRGAVHVALDERLPVAATLHLVEHAEARLLFVADERLTELNSTAGQRSPVISAAGELSGRALAGASLAAVRERLERYANLPAQPQAAAQILYTSGTMSQPKGVMLSHRNLLSNARAKLEAAPQFVDDVRLNVLPFAHAYARTCELSTWVISGSLLCIARDWHDFLELGPRVRPTLVNLVPHLAQKLVVALEQFNGPSDDGSAGRGLLGDRLRLLQVGGASLPQAIWNRLAEQGWPPVQGYGLTEASPVICSNRAGDQRCDSVGPAVAGVELRIDDKGVLWTRGPHVMLGYWRAPDETALKIQDGWLCTGDLAEKTDDGRWRIIGRADDQITLSTGYKASPHELARRLALDAWIDQLVIVGQDRPHLAAFVHPRWSELPAELFAGGEPQSDLANDLAEPAQRLNASRFEQALAARWSATLAELPRQLRIERIGLLRQPLRSETGGLNFKGAVRRKFVEQVLLAREVAELYESSSLPT